MEKMKITPKIKVISFGGAGTNMINRIIETTENKDIDYISISTSREELNQSNANSKLLIGEKITKGLGTSGDVSIGVKSVNESKKEITEFLQKELKDTNIVFIVTALGGGTGTGITPVITNMIRKMGIVTICIFTVPFSFEAEKRKGIIQTFKDLDDSVRQSVQDLINSLLSYDLEDLSYKYLLKLIQEEII